MPKVKAKVIRNDAEDDDKGRQWMDKETSILLDVWATTSVKEMLDGPNVSGLQNRIDTHTYIACKKQAGSSSSAS